MTLATQDVLGAWLAIFLTVCILSFLYEDNPVYKLAEHIFLGVSIAIGVLEAWYGVFEPNLINKLMGGHLLSLVPLTLIVLLFGKLVRSVDWVAKIPIAFIVATFAGLNLTGEAKANLMSPMAASMPNLIELWQQNYPGGGGLSTVAGLAAIGKGLFNIERDGAGVLSGVLLVAGICGTLLHFYFSAAHNRPMQYVSRFAVIVLMLSFGASFGYTVMGRISLAIGRAQVLMGMDRSPEEVAQIHPQAVTLVSMVVIAGIIAAWKAKSSKATTAA